MIDHEHVYDNFIKRDVIIGAGELIEYNIVLECSCHESALDEAEIIHRVNAYDGLVAEIAELEGEIESFTEQHYSV